MMSLKNEQLKNKCNNILVMEIYTNEDLKWHKPN